MRSYQLTYNVWHQYYCSETQEAQGVRVHPHRPERKAGRDRKETKEVIVLLEVKVEGARMK